MLQLHDVEVRVVMEFDNIETIKRAIEIDAGVGLLPQPTVLREVAAGTLVAVPLATDELVRPLGIIHRRGKDLGGTVRRFIDLLCSEGKETAASGRAESPRPIAARSCARTAAETAKPTNGYASRRLPTVATADSSQAVWRLPSNRSP